MGFWVCIFLQTLRMQVRAINKRFHNTRQPPFLAVLLQVVSVYPVARNIAHSSIYMLLNYYLRLRLRYTVVFVYSSYCSCILASGLLANCIRYAFRRLFECIFLLSPQLNASNFLAMWQLVLQHQFSRFTRSSPT